MKGGANKNINLLVNEVEILFFSNHLNHTELEEISYIDYIQNAKDKTSYIEVVLFCLLAPFTFQEDLIWSFLFIVVNLQLIPDYTDNVISFYESFYMDDYIHFVENWLP